MQQELGTVTLTDKQFSTLNRAKRLPHRLYLSVFTFCLQEQDASHNMFPGTGTSCHIHTLEWDWEPTTGHQLRTEGLERRTKWNTKAFCESFKHNHLVM